MLQDPQLRRAVPVHAIQVTLQQAGLRDYQIIDRALRGYARRPALGERGYDIAPNAETGRNGRAYKQHFQTISYETLRHRIERLANAWAHDDLHKRTEGEFVCILGSASIDFVVVDLACAYGRLVTVPLQGNLPLDELARIVADIAPPVLVTSCANLPLAVLLVAGAPTIRSVIVMDFEPRDDFELAQFNSAKMQIESRRAGISFATLNELVAFGSQFSWQAPDAAPIGDNRIAGLVYTSGATGTPKGAILDEESTKIYWTEGVRGLPKITVAYLPMNHLMGRHAVYSTISQGGTVHFTLKDDLSTLLEDIRLVRPTILSFIPRVAQSIFQHYRMEVARRIGRGIDVKDARAAVIGEMRRTYLGDRLCIGTIGGAPTAPNVLAFLRGCFEMAITESYGSTESGGLTVGEKTMDNVTDYKVIDAPELGYLASDKPFPRGELLLKTKSQISGYFRNPEATARLFDDDGFVRTGDIVEERGPGQIVWLDRKNEVLKLAQGEFVAIAHLESIFEGGDAVIRQIFVYGNPLQSNLLAVVVPELEIAARRLGRPMTLPDLRQHIRATLQRVGKAANLRSFEIPREVIIETEPFTTENGLLTNVGKPRRPQLKQKYAPRLEKLYAAIERRERAALLSLKDADSTDSVAGKIAKALTAALGLGQVDPSTRQSFAELGGDSLSAVSLSLLLEQMFNVAVPVGAILSPTGNIATWAQLITTALASTGDRKAATRAKIDGHSPVVRARDVRLDALLDMDAFKVVSREAPAGTKSILLTGATGFLGRFLCLAWMKRLAPDNGKVICLVRAPDAALARQRLVDSLIGMDPALDREFRALARDTLEVVTGDLAEPLLGLNGSDYERLATSVDQVVHAGALVNHVLPYQHLFEPNVVGTAALIRFALTGQRKRFDFISSVTVARIGDDAGAASEDDPPAPSIILKDGYAAGYTASKWAAEMLLRNAHEEHGLPVTIFRPSMILAHRTYRGQVNLPDMFSRLLYSIVAAGVAPKTFYRGHAGSGPSGAHYDGLPVDYVADFIANASGRAGKGFATYNVVNMHDDDVSLDRIVDWIVSAGYPVARVAHRQWFKDFEAKLGALPDVQRQHSALPIMAAFRTLYPARTKKIGSAGFEAYARECAGADIPHLTEQFVHKILDDLRLLTLIPKP